MLKNTGSDADQKYDKAIAELYPRDAEAFFRKSNVFLDSAITNMQLRILTRP
ncbi:MAG: hypothetical protein NTX75_04130 [Proteobacteria bacterium]|nr:hypothetical protein [Pseudomonadota bacterium]